MRKINFRPLLFIVIAFCLALGFSRYIFAGNISSILFVLLLTIFVLYLCIKHKCMKRFVLLFCVFVFGSLYYFLGYFVFIGNDYSNQNFNISARVCQIYDNSTYKTLILDEVKIDNNNKSFCISCTYSGEVKLGNIITFSGKLKKVELFDNDTFNSFYYKNKTSYKSSIDSAHCQIESGYVKLNEKIRTLFCDFVESHFNESIAPIIESVIVGDKTNLDNNIKQGFSSAGISHLLAISGLHISVIVAILSFILDKLKIKGKLNFVVMAIILLLYSYICNFSPSVCRASIMSLCLLFGKCSGKRYDSLSALSFSAIIILMFKPLYIFDAGFLLSFLCVFSILTLNKPIHNLLEKIKCPQKLNNALSIILSSQIGILPILCMFYKSFNLLSIFVNLICVPIFEIAFVLTFIILPLSIIPFLSFLTTCVEFLYFAIVMIASVFANLSFLSITLTKTNIIVICSYYLSIFILSRFVNITKKEKLKNIALIVLVASILSIFNI